MMNAVIWALAQSVKVLGLVGAWYLFKYIVSNGSETIRDILETTGMGIQAGCYHLKKLFWEKIKKERNPESGQTESVEAEGSVK